MTHSNPMNKGLQANFANDLYLKKSFQSNFSNDFFNYSVDPVISEEDAQLENDVPTV